MEIKDSIMFYFAPQAKVIEVNVKNVLCGSDPKETYITEMEEGDGNW